MYIEITREMLLDAVVDECEPGYQRLAPFVFDLTEKLLTADPQKNIKMIESTINMLKSMLK